ncbi:hypothetical protein [Rurimicrobium arvi]|uniref:Phage protein n=1 Tax=Rurimicrobium arvi TaxID=2049916 RepID=A0ABP8MQ31_9BACT
MDRKYKGMTVNERLYISGFIDEFDQATKQHDIQRVIKILKEVEITDKNEVSAILNKLGLSEK